MQRERDFDAYQDLESHFERRPSLWVEPIGDWGEGVVQLVEIPTKEEVHDNIVAFWQPEGAAARPRASTSTPIACIGAPDTPKPSALADFTRTRVGARGDNDRLFVLDIVGDKLKGLDPNRCAVMVTAEQGQDRQRRQRSPIRRPAAGG